MDAAGGRAEVMFARGISILLSSTIDVGNISVPRPWDKLADSCVQGAQRALQSEPEFLSPSQRLRDPPRYRKIQRARREQLERFLWVEANAAALDCMADLIAQICEEGRWSATEAAFDEPSHPDIDLQAAETGALFAWILRRHGARLAEYDARIPGVLLYQVRSRLLRPVCAHEDYPFMRGQGRCPALVLADLLLCAMLMEKSPAHRQQPVKLILRMLDKLCAAPQAAEAPLSERLADACAIADLVRLLKRLTRGELDLTRQLPASAWLDEVLIPWIARDCFCDPNGSGMHPQLSGIDLFRLGYLSRDSALCALGAQLHRLHGREAFSLTGHVLSMEYMGALEDSRDPVPRFRRAAACDNLLMLSRSGACFAAIWATGARKNAGSIALFSESRPILVDAGGDVHSLPLIEDCAPLDRPVQLPEADADFGRDRDLMSVDLTGAYAGDCPLNVYQRTLMTQKNDGTVRLVDAFEFSRPIRQITFRFVTAQKPLALGEVVRLGPVTLSWDGEMQPQVEALSAPDPFEDGVWLLHFTLRQPPQRFICGFAFENDE